MRLNRLTARKVATAAQPGLYADGGGLCLRVGRGGAKSWVLRYMLKGAAREMGLGSIRTVTLSSSLARHVSPVFGSAPVGSVDVGMVMNVLEPLWAKAPETASRIRGRIESILDWAKARGFRSGENPARWRGHLDHLLPARSKVRAPKHYAALPYTNIAGFMADLRSRGGVGASALEFLILCAARSSEIASARWAEIDRAARVWTVPAERMKGGREHRVPLSGAAMAVLDRIATSGDFIFSNEPGRGLGKGALGKQLKGRDCTVHGFRSTFRDWAAERTNFPREVAEAVLAHAIDNKVEAAYRRGDLFEKRRRLMDAWAEFCAKPSALAGEVVALRTATECRS
jgi:integrase